MPKDYANIYNLPDHEKKAEIKDLWGNCIPGSKERAEQLAQKIAVLETPYVLSLEADYGMGKTYFATRFCEYLKSNGIDALYISAWEQDYQPSPFCFIASEIICYLKQQTEPTTKSSLSHLIKKGAEVTKSLLSASHIQFGSNGCGIDVDTEKFCKGLMKPKDNIKAFKQELEKTLKNNNIKPLVVIIDELDRCRPDYALKTLEIVKHFFDIDNIFVILPINKSALEHAVISTYGDFKTDNEQYLRKLITENYYLEKPSVEQYEKIIKAYITQERLNNEINNKSIILSPKGCFNSFDMISKYIARYASMSNLTYRETVNVCRQFIEIVHKIKGNVYIEYLAYLLCDTYRHVKVLELDANHPFRMEIHHENHPKYKILCIDDLYNQAHGLSNCNMYTQILCDCVKELKKLDRSSHFSSYEELYNYINEVLKYKDKLLSIPMSTEYEERLKKTYESIIKSQERAVKYQIKYGSTDDDEKIKTYYDKIVKDPLLLYEK